MFVQVHVCQCGPEANVWSLPQLLSLFFFEIESVDDLEMVLVRPVSPKDPPVYVGSGD